MCAGCTVKGLGLLGFVGLGSPVPGRLVQSAALESKAGGTKPALVLAPCSAVSQT